VSRAQARWPRRGSVRLCGRSGGRVGGCAVASSGRPRRSSGVGPAVGRSRCLCGRSVRRCRGGGPQHAGRAGRRPYRRAACPGVGEAGRGVSGPGRWSPAAGSATGSRGCSRRRSGRSAVHHAVTQHVDLRARFAAVDRVWTGEIAPFSARTEIESTTARDQSISLTTPRRCKSC